MAEIQDLVVIDDNNTARWPENMEFSDVNNAARADEGLLARWYKDMDTSIVASGSANAFAITSNRVIASLFNNLVIAWTANHSITGASTLALNGLAAKSIKRFNGDALAQGDIISGQACVTVYKSSGDQWFLISAPAALTGNSFADFDENAAPGTPAADDARMYAFDDGGTTRMAYKDSAGTITVLGSTATQAQMEAASSTAVASSPGRQHNHPGHAKAAARSDSSGNIIGTSFNIASIVRNSTGVFTVTMTNAMNDTNYGVVAAAQHIGSTTSMSVMYEISSSSVFVLRTMRPGAGGGSALQDSGFTFAVYGDMP